MAKIKDIAILIKADDNKTYQLVIDKKHSTTILNVITQLHGKLEAFDNPIEGIEIYGAENEVEACAHEFILELHSGGLGEYVCRKCGKAQTDC
jgi:hypothetical protein